MRDIWPDLRALKLRVAEFVRIRTCYAGDGHQPRVRILTNSATPRRKAQFQSLRAWATGIVCHAAMVLAVASSLSAQVFRESGAMFAPPDRQSLGILDTSRELLDQGRYSEAVQLLVTILEAKDDYFFMAANQADEPNAGRQYQSLKNEARSVLSGMPPAAQQAYELRFGAVARQLLDDALAEGDLEQALEVQRRYFGSAAGYEAMYLLGCYALNQGRSLTAIRHFQTLQSSSAAARYEPELSLKLAICWQWAGEPTEAQAVLVELQKRIPRARFVVGGRSVELFRRSEDALDWLRNIAGEPPAENGSPSAAWTMFRHDPARQGRGSGGPNLSTQPVWRQAAADRLELALALQAQRDEFFRGAEVAVPSLTPLAVDDTVVMRTTQRLVAVDFKTGKRLWQVDQPAPQSGAATPAGSDDSSPRTGPAQATFVAGHVLRFDQQRRPRRVRAGEQRHAFQDAGRSPGSPAAAIATYGQRQAVQRAFGLRASQPPGATYLVGGRGGRCEATARSARVPGTATSARWAVIRHRGNRGCHPSGRVQPEVGRVALVPAVGIYPGGPTRSAAASHPRDQPFVRRRDLDLSDGRGRRGRRRTQHSPPVVGPRVSGGAACGTNHRRERNCGRIRVP
jgi:tetratricopeptide (TPR) repeat protein